MIEVRNLSKSYGRKAALIDLNWRLSTGVCGLLGANGAGKTTLMRCLLGLIGYQKGLIQIHGKLLKPGYPPPSVGYLPQRFNLFRELTVLDMLRYFANQKEIPVSGQKRAIEECLDMVNLVDRINTVCRSLSGGMVRRLGIAQALLGNPDILIFDEPTAGLDPEERMRFKLILKRLPVQCTIILSTHIVDDVEGICHSLAILDQGRLIKHGPIHEIAGQARGKVVEIPETYLADLSPDTFVEHIFERDQQTYCRILVNPAQSAKLAADLTTSVFVEPDVEDGYMALIKNI